MQRAFVDALKAMLFVLLTASAALAVDSPHTSSLGCTGCHIAIQSPTGGFTYDLSNTSGVNNLCLTCHNPATMARSFSPKDIATPFGSTVMGVYTSGRLQTSHNWAAPVNVPAAGAATPVDPAIKTLQATQAGIISCASCHNQHATTGGGLLRMPGNSDLLCFDCHRSRNQRNHLTGTHPVNFSYTSATSKVRLKPTDYLATPVNANPANPTSAMKLPGGKLICTTCHGIHFSDSNSTTFDNHSSSYLGQLSPSQGYLLRTDMRGATASAVNICTNCHTNKTAHNYKGQNIQCADCHAGHVDPGDGTAPNVWLVRRYMNYSGGIQLSSYRTKVFYQYTGSQRNFAGPYGVCQACHNVPIGPSYPSEHTSTDPNVCASCHTHNNSSGSFAGSCTACHGFPPHLNIAGGPDGYAKTSTYNYANSPAFKDESQTGHMVHAGKSLYSFGCSECHAGNKHASGNFQQLFNTKVGIIAAAGGAVPMYNTASPGTCSVYCHSNGAPSGGTIAFKFPQWANAKNSIIGTPGECGACHDATPATNVHTGHITNGFACSVCHAATVSGNSAIIDAAKHVNDTKDVMFSGTAAIDSSAAFSNATHLCTNIYCHSNGNQKAFVYANPAAWTAPIKYGCNGCHGTSSPVGAPDYPNGGAGKSTANTHAAHVAGATSTTVCANCHFVTASPTVPGTLIAGSRHLNAAVNVVFNPALAGPNAVWDSNTGTCTNVACHGNAPAQWGSTAGCLTCHSLSIGNRAAIGPQFSGNSHHIQGTDLTGTHCYQCHWEANSDGTINHTYHHSSTPGGPVELVVYGGGARPAAYVVGTTAIPYTANGTRAEMAKINTHCIGCHSDQNKTTQPFGDGKTPSSYAWDAASIGAKFGDTGTTPWSKYSGNNVTPKNTVTKAFSAHGNAVNNKGGWDTTETWKDRTATANVLCFDCHNSHGSNVSGITTSYASATTNGGILKDIVAGKGGYPITYQPTAGGSAADHNAYNAGAGLCFDCHMKSTAAATPWGYNSTFGSTQQIMGFADTPYFGTGTFGRQLMFSYKATPNMGGHFGVSSSLSSPPAHAIGGLCTPCHDPHGVSPTLGTNKGYAVPLLKGTWVTSPYKEDVTTADNQNYIAIAAVGYSGDYEGPTRSQAKKDSQAAAMKSYKIDQNTFSTTAKMNAAVTGVTETDTQFAGLCLNCHAKQALTDGANHTWKDKNRIHESVKGWKTANTTIQHNYTCSKCHAPHNASLPRLMVTNCLDKKHKGRTAYNASPITSGSYRGSEGSGSGHQPGSYSAIVGEGGRTTVNNSFTCHENNDTTQQWNVKTPWGSPANLNGLSAPVLVTEPNLTCSTSSCAVALQWNASTNTSGAAVQYQVQVSSSDLFSSVNYSSGWISTTSWSVNLPKGTWFWRVQARDSKTTSKVSAWSAVGDFVLLNTPPSTPVLIHETNSTCSSSACAITLAWNKSTNSTSNAVQYSVEVSSSSTFATIDYSSGWITSTSWSATLGSGTWYWRVKARDAVIILQNSAWSTTDTFTVSGAASTSPPTAPVVIAEPDASCSSYSGCSIGLQWNPSTNPSGGSVQYLVQVSSSSTFSTIKSSSSWQTGTSWSTTLTKGTWYWRVEARDASVTTRVSPWSSTDTFILN